MLRQPECAMRAPPPQGLYDPACERDGCGMGFVAHIKGARSNEIIAHGLRVLANLDHRGGVGADPTLGDGAGCLIQIPDALFRAWAAAAQVQLPSPGDYAVATCFLPIDAESRAAAIERFERYVKVEDMSSSPLSTVTTGKPSSANQ
jgi:glutamate synthase (NADPH/NADH) large chain